MNRTRDKSLMTARSAAGILCHTDSPKAAMSRIFVPLYGAASYVIFLASFLYAVAWLGNFIAPKTIDSGSAGSLLGAIFVNLGLLTAFAVQHSVMARPAFKREWTKVVSPAIERSTYVLLASLLLFAICFGWRSMPAVVWQAEGAAAAAMWALFALGWLVVLLSTFMINHFELFGLRQVWLHARGRAYSAPRYVERFFYRFVRHPIMLGFLIAFWSGPTMTVGHLLFAAVTTAYILVALQLEERDLLAEHGASYAAYRERVPMLVPGTKLAPPAGRVRPS
jgi:protein-S-isoprenylcysteine O-methyltransferase Ste14